MIPKESEEDHKPVTKLEPADEIEEFRQALAEEKARADANLAGWQRAQADFINYRRRSEQEKADMAKYANAGLVQGLLPVLDDLERAFTCMPDELRDISWVEGLKLIWQKFRSILERQGLTEIEAVGEPFDPNIHEAVMQGKGKEDIVVGEIQKGYKLHEQILRPTKAIVGAGDEGEGGINGESSGY